MGTIRFPDLLRPLLGHSPRSLGRNTSMVRFFDSHVGVVSGALSEHIASLLCLVDSQSQARKTFAALKRDPDPYRARLIGVRFEPSETAFLEPGDCLSRSAEPGAPALQILDQIAIASTPQPFRGEAAIVPIDRQRASKADGVVCQLAEPGARLPWRKPQIAQIE